MDQYPPNSDASKNPPPEDVKKVERVTSSEPIRRRKSLGKQFKSTFFGGDAKSALRYVMFDVLVPAAKDAIAEAGSEWWQRLVFGDTRRKRSAPPSGPQGYVSYNRYAMQGHQEPPRAMSRQGRARHNFDEIVLTSRTEAEEVIDRMFDILGRYDAVSVADLYGLVGIDQTHTDYKWGWTDLRGSGVARVRSGYLLDLPDPDPLTN
jgi:hypothetical protein